MLLSSEHDLSKLSNYAYNVVFYKKNMIVLILKLSKCLFVFLMSHKHVVIIIYLVLCQSNLFGS
jgi:hypothetical protein